MAQLIFMKFGTGVYLFTCQFHFNPYRSTNWTFSLHIAAVSIWALGPPSLSSCGCWVLGHLTPRAKLPKYEAWPPTPV